MPSRIKYFFSSKFTYKDNIEAYKNLFIIIIFITLPFLFFKNSIFLNTFLHGTKDSDVQSYSLPFRDFLINSYKSLNIPLWNPYNFNGIPFFADMQTGSLNFINIILGLIFPELVAYNLSIFFYYSLAGIFTYFFVKEYNLSRTSAFSSGLMFMFSGFMIIRKTHANMLYTAVWLPLILYLIEKYIKTKNRRYIILSSIILAIQFFNGYPAIFLYSSSIIFLYIIASFLKIKNFKEIRSGLRKNLYILNLFLIFVSGILLISIQLIPSYELMKLSFRDKLDYESFTLFSFDFKQIPLLFFPYIYGKNNINQLKDVSTIFNSSYLEMGMYLGIFPFFFAIIGFFNKNKWKIFWGIIALISILLVFGKNLPFYRLTYFLPLFKSFRISTRHWFEFCFALSVLGGFGIEYIIKSKYKDFRKTIMFIISLISFFLICFFSFYFYFKKYVIFNNPSFLNLGDYSFFNISEVNKSFSINKSTVYIPLILFSSCIILFIFFIILKKIRPYIKKTIFLIIPIFIFLDLFSFGYNFESIAKFNIKETINNDKIIQYLKKDNDLFRVFPASDMQKTAYKNLGYNINLFSGIYNMVGYNPLYLKDYNDITKINMSGFSTVPVNLLISNNNILSISNCKYILVPQNQINNNSNSEIRFTPESKVSNYIENSQLVNDNIILKYLLNNSFILNNYKKKSFKFKGNSTDLKVLNIPIKLEKNQLYKLKFAIKKADSYETIDKNSDHTIHFDFYGAGKNSPDYDNTNQEYTFDSLLMSQDFKEYSEIIDSGNVPENMQIYFRIFYWNTGDFELKDLTLTKLENSYESIMISDGYLLLKNKKFLPRFYFIKNVINVDNVNEARDKLWDNAYDPSDKALVEDYDLKVSKFNNYVLNSVSVLKYENNFVDLKVNMKEDGFLVFSDTYYQGWRAYIDGRETKIYKTNGMFKGIYIPAGEHKIRFRFLPNDFLIGSTISCITFIILIVLLVTPLKKGRKIKKVKIK